MAENHLLTKSITELLGMNFYIPEYQRGYRWTKTNVLQLLNDIWEYRQEAANQYSFYCLQPVVVRKHTWNDKDGKEIKGYELIDGQQRLTTIHRIITYLMAEFLKIDSLSVDYKNELYKLYYKTRMESATFLSGIRYDNSKPDLYYMSEAYECIKSWFEDEEKGLGRSEKNRFLDVLLPEQKIQEEGGTKQYPEWSVQVIWYEINDADQKSEDLFTRLNRGKIPLTSSELIKAKFVNADSFKGFTSDEKIKRRTQLVQIWDEIENQLNNPKFWAFISNVPITRFSNKIEYLFDIITGKKPGEKDLHFSFVNFFEAKESADSLWNKWMDVEELYRALSFWFTDKTFYHKIGFLIAVGTSIKTLVDLRKDHTKNSFEAEIDRLIGASIHPRWDELSYEKPSQHNDIVKTLLLTNIELILKNKHSHEFFPFDQYKSITKSLEHIHAQNIDGINRNNKSEWKLWLNAHIEILPQVSDQTDKVRKLVDEINGLDVDDKNYKFEDFKKHSNRVLELIPVDETHEGEFLNRIENMALLGLNENISLSNSVFEVKRRKIIALDKEGIFIPQATKRVFLKYYDTENSRHYAVWKKGERTAYLDDIRNCVETYKTINTEADEE